jgi:hypothetical protein
MIHLEPILSRLVDSEGGGQRRPPPNAEIPKEDTAAAVNDRMGIEPEPNR